MIVFLAAALLAFGFVLAKGGGIGLALAAAFFVGAVAMGSIFPLITSTAANLTIVDKLGKKAAKTKKDGEYE